MTWAPSARSRRSKVRRYTKKLLWRARQAELMNAALLSKAARDEYKRGLKADAKIDAALEGCEDR